MLLLFLSLGCTEPQGNSFPSASGDSAQDDSGDDSGDDACVGTMGEVEFLLTEEDLDENRPVQGNIQITHSDGQELWLITNNDGEVTMDFQQGDYTADAESTWCIAETVPFTVEPCGEHFVEVVLSACIG